MNIFRSRNICCFLSLFSGLCLSLAASLAQATNVKLSDITKQIPVETRLHGQFIQSKQLSEIPFPIVSTGNFYFDANTGLHWNTLQPIASQLLISKTHILQFENGKEVLRIGIASNPILSLIGTIFVSALTGDYQKLEQYFDIQPSLLDAQPESQWKMTLTPKQSLLKNFSKKIEIFGDQAIEKLLFYDTSGDLTSIRFHSFTAVPASE